MDIHANPDEINDIDIDNDMILTHFENCTNNSSQEIKDKRGIITDLQGKIICKTFPFIEEYVNIKDNKTYSSFIDFKTMRFFESHEGTMVRLYNHKNKWFLSTHKKLNAFNSYWGSNQSFGKMFIKALQYAIKGDEKEKNDENFSSNKEMNKLDTENEDDNLFDRYCFNLNPNYVYCYLVRNNFNNRIVCDSPQNPTMYCVGIFDKNGKLIEIGSTNSSNIKSPCEYYFKNINDFNIFINDINYKKIQGILVYRSNGTLFKVINDKYYELYNIRGNQPSLKYRYLQLRKHPELVSMLIKLYPYKESRFEYYENNLRLLAQKIFTTYMDRFIFKKFVILKKSQYAVMMTAHNLFKTTGNKITIQIIYNIIDNLNASKLMSLLRSFEEKNE